MRWEAALSISVAIAAAEPEVCPLRHALSQGRQIFLICLVLCIRTSLVFAALIQNNSKASAFENIDTAQTLRL
jgi:uncharacterized membrane protein